MKIIKKDGTVVLFDKNKFYKRIKNSSAGLKNINIEELIEEISSYLHDNVNTYQIDDLICNIAKSKISNHFDYNILAKNIYVSKLHKELEVNAKSWLKRCGKALNNTVIENYNNLLKYTNFEINYNIDYNFNYESLILFEKTYAIKENNKCIETPAEMFLRIALNNCNGSLDDFNLIYEDLCSKKISCASPILFNSGLIDNSQISCVLLTLKEDSLKGILKTFKSIALSSKNGAGIGLYIGNLRSKLSKVNNKGNAGGIVKFCKMLEPHLNFFNQNGIRNGSCAVYLDIWHADIEDFLELKLEEGDIKLRAYDLFTGVVINNLFYEKLKKGEDWYLFCPKILKDNNIDLIETHNEEFEYNFNLAVKKNLYYKKISCIELIQKLTLSLLSSGNPYILNKDIVNYTHNQTFGTIKSSNLCIEYLSYSDETNEAQCDLSSINLSQFIKNDKVDYLGIYNTTQNIVLLLNNILDNNKWSSKKAKKTALLQRTIGIGILGLQELFFKLKLPFTSEEAKEINLNIQKIIYFAALDKSASLNKKYNIYNNTKADNGILHYEHYGVNPNFSNEFIKENNLPILNWNKLKNKIKENKLCNSLLVVNLPSATTSIFMGTTESFEPQYSNVYVRETLNGEFTIINNHLLSDLQDLNLWNDDIRTKIIKNDGSIQNIDEIPNHIKEIYKTVWEISQKELINICASRQAFIDQSISMNLYFSNPDENILVNALLHSYDKKLKTGVYYTRTRTSLKANKELGLHNKNFECFGCT